MTTYKVLAPFTILKNGVHTQLEKNETITSVEALGEDLNLYIINGSLNETAYDGKADPKPEAKEEAKNTK